jgi:YesN/AraC family two-component response regulator
VIIICVKGQAWCATNAGQFEVRAGQVIILPPSAPHSYGADEDDPWTLWWLHIDGKGISEFLNYYRMTIEAPVRNVSDMYEAVFLVAEVIKWMQRDTTNSSLLAAAGAAWRLMTLIASDHAGAGDVGDAIVRSAAYLRNHADRRVNVTDLADMAGFSNSHFAALFKRHTGFAVGYYQTQLRIASARELLDTTNRSVEEIANSVGYEDSYYFARQFKKVHGVPPSIYRKHDEGVMRFDQ